MTTSRSGPLARPAGAQTSLGRDDALDSVTLAYSLSGVAEMVQWSWETYHWTAPRLRDGSGGAPSVMPGLHGARGERESRLGSTVTCRISYVCACVWKGDLYGKADCGAGCANSQLHIVPVPWQQVQEACFPVSDRLNQSLRG